MLCPRCGHASIAGDGSCAVCGARLAHSAGDADATLGPGATIGAGPTVGATVGPPADMFPSTGIKTFGATEGGGASRDPGTADGATIAAASGPLKVGQAFSARYHIIKLLGAGGMGAVYQAWDAELGVAVALKVIRADRRRGTVSPEAEKRFKTELLLARKVTHKHVVRIHDLGEIDGIKYITMPYVQGDDLGTVLRREGKLPIDRALRLARQIADGLEAAHEAGVVHRDLKPPNIMISGKDADEQALIMDFGISSSAADATSGAIVGTLEYMSPEQGTAQAVDARCDQYAFGLIVYEMLAGMREPPASGLERVNAMRARFEQGVPPLRTIDGTVPEPVEAIVMRCLERDAAARFQTTAELTAALRRLDDAGQLIPDPPRLTRRMQVATLALVAALLGTTWYLARGPALPVEHPPMSVLIADFDNRAADSTFDGALETALGVALEGASFVNLFDRGDAQRLAEQYKGDNRVDEQTARLISVREGINLIVSGSIERQGAGYLLSATLIDAAHVIDNPQNAEPPTVVTAKAAGKGDVLRAVASLAANVRTTLGDTTPAPQLRAADETFTAASLEAIRSYTQAQDFANDDNDEQAAEYYRRATEQDPNFGRAYAGLALSTELLGRSEESAELWKKALSLLDRMTEREKLRTLGVYYRRVAHNNDKAIEVYTELVQKYPADGTGHNNLAVAYFATRNFPKAFEAGGRALELAPKRERYQTNYALYAMYAGDFTQASAKANEIVKEHPEALYAYLPLAVGALAAGNADAARDAYQRMAATGTVGSSLANMGLVDVALYRGLYDEAERLLQTGLADDRQAKNTMHLAIKNLMLAEVQIARGRTRPAVEAIRQALALRKDDTIVVPAARLYLQAGNEAEPKRIAGELLSSLQAESRAYGQVITGEIALRNRRTIDAVESFRAALKLSDLWLARYLLGVAYVEAGGHDAEALSELDACFKRRGEAASLFLDDMPSFRYLTALPYWLARVQQQVGLSEPARANFTQYLNLRGDVKPPDRLAADARKRLAPR
jgi:tetratricopeptide (TPR) repeat protein/predicted Ser/Thr protein kinase